jgi:UPF0042 nucleotide-binding protein
MLLRARPVSMLGRRLAVRIVAFGFKHGLPADIDLLFDVRFLRNPNYEPDLEPLTGEDPAVGAYIAADASTAPFLEKLFNLIDFLIPLYSDERGGLTIAIGCTGGRHRSVYIAHRLCAHLESNDAVDVNLEMRDAQR